MLKQIEIEKKWGTYQEVVGLYKTEKDSRIKIRLLEIKLAYEGEKSEEIAKIVSEEGSTVREHMHRWNRHGYEGLRDKAHPEAESIMNDGEMAAIDEALKKSPRESGITRSNWTGPLLQEWIKEQFQKAVSHTTSYNILHRLNYTKTRPRKKCKKAVPDEADEYRRKIEEIINTKEESTVLLYEDEAIFTSDPTITATWTKKGEQGIVPTSGDSWDRKAVFGAVNPESGELFEMVADAANTENFKEFMLNVYNAITPKNAILPLDNASYHHFRGIEEWWKDNIHTITPLYIPAYCSELNPVEHLWKSTRSNVTHNTLFKNIADLISHVRDYFNELKSTPSALAKLCHAIY